MRPAGEPERLVLAPGPQGCQDDHCITCGDEAVEVTVLELLPDDLAVVDAGGGRREEISVAFVTASVGARVLVHAGEAIGMSSTGGEP